MTSHNHPLRKTPFSVLTAALLLSGIPTAAAHGGHSSGFFTQGIGIGIVSLGIFAAGFALLAKRRSVIAPKTALYAILGGLCVIALGTVIFEGTSADPIYSADTMPFPRTWYGPMALLSGMGIAIASFVLVLFRWSHRPRYAFFGLLMALWISYPYLVPGMASDTHPLGYLIVLATPIVIGYIVFKDVGDVLRGVFRDSVARRFGIGVALILGFFFFTMSGYLSFFPDPGVPNESAIVVLPVLYQLVIWPTLELAFPSLSFFMAISPGQFVIVGTISTLVGINAAVIARYWRLEVAAGTTQGTAGTASIIGTCTCGCCGPLVAKVTLLAGGPALSAPLYWIFVDSASPLSAVFIVTSLTLFTSSLIYSVRIRSSGGPGLNVGAGRDGSGQIETTS